MERLYDAIAIPKSHPHYYRFNHPITLHDDVVHTAAVNVADPNTLNFTVTIPYSFVHSVSVKHSQSAPDGISTFL